jgi:SsrA-binding protein
MTETARQGDRQVAVNRRAFHDYFVLDRYEAGIELRGSEVKSIRAGQASFAGAFATVDGTEVLLQNLSIAAYAFANRFNHEPGRPRRLLLHAREIDRLRAQSELKGHALIPLRLYFKHGLVKVELGVCRGKRFADKRETLRRRTVDREAEQAMRRR